jgi:hypothetical protein
MIAVANPKLSSKEARAQRKASKLVGLASSRAVHRMVDETQKRAEGKPTKAERRARGAELAAARKARNKADRLARRPREVTSQDDKTFMKMIRKNTVLVGAA